MGPVQHLKERLCWLEEVKKKKKEDWKSLWRCVACVDLCLLLKRGGPFQLKRVIGE
jgi:hypothetical protein